MGRPVKPPRIWERTPGQYLILDRGKQISAGNNYDEAVARLHDYIFKQEQEPKAGAKPDEALIGPLLDYYYENHGRYTLGHKAIAGSVRFLKGFWGDKTISEVTIKNSRAYAEYRTRPYTAKDNRRMTPGVAAVRKDLGFLQAAIGFCYRDQLITHLTRVTLGEQLKPRERWLTRDEAARLLKSAAPHVRRFILIALYTGTRRSAILRLRWRTSALAGYADTRTGYIVRKGPQEPATKKRRGPVRMPKKLLSHMKAWEKQDLSQGIYDVIHYHGPITTIRTAFDAAVERAGLTGVTPHTLKHTSVTWFFQSGGSLEDAVDFFDTTADTLLSVYRQHSVDHQSRAAGNMDKAGRTR